MDVCIHKHTQRYVYSYLIEVLLQRRVLPEEEAAKADLVGGTEDVHVLVEEVDDRLAVVHLQTARKSATKSASDQ